jgi:hypothetical protein
MMKLRGGRSTIEAPSVTRVITTSNKKAKTSNNNSITNLSIVCFRKPTTRSQSQEESPLVVLESLNASSRRTTRTTKPACIIYGRERNIRYRGFFFCLNCEWWDTDSSLGLTQRSHPNSKRYRCTAKHTSWCFPTQKIIPHHYLLSNKKTDGAVDDTLESYIYGGDDAREDVTTEETDHEKRQFNDALIDDTNLLQRTSDCSDDDSDAEEQEATTEAEEDNEQSLYNQVGMLNTKLKASQAKCRWLISQMKGLTREQTNPNDHGQRHLLLRKTFCLLTQVNGQCRQRVSDEKLSLLVANLTWSNEFLSGLVRGHMITKVRQHIRQNVYSPDLVLRAMDLKGGQLSSHGIEVLLELDFPGVKRAQNKVLPSPAALKRIAEVVEHYGNHICPFTTGFLPNGGGEFVEFDPKSVVSLIVKSFQLEDIAKTRPVTLSQSIDGAQLNKRDTHVLYGMKVNDKAAICPVTKQPIFANPDKTTLQSRNNCFPLKMILARETKQIYQEFKVLFDMFKAEGTVEESLLGDAYLPINIATNCDMSAVWKGLGRGGAAKRNLNPCQCCEILSDNLVKPNTYVCNRWCRQFGRSETNGEWKCYHHDMLDEDRLQSMREEMEEVKRDLKELVQDMEEIAQQSYIKINEDPRSQSFGNAHNEITSIHYSLNEKTEDQVRMYSRYLTMDLMLRDLDTSGGIEERRERLQDSLVLEYSYSSLQSAINHGTKGTENALFIMINAVPCILHMENRVGLKILTRLLMAGLDNAKKGLLYADENSVNERMLLFIKGVENVLNTQAWGTVESPSQWQCSYNPADKQIDIICLDNVRTRKAIYALDNLIDLCLPDDELATKWKICIGHYRNAMELMRQKDDFTDEQIFTFQKACDDFFQIWVDINAVEGVTNYIHMLGSGHVSDYLVHWRNLYAHSQQGWEAFNALVKTYYFRRTNRGGAGNKGTGQRSKLKGLARWMQRRMVWFSGVPFAEMIAFFKLPRNNEGDGNNDEEDEDDAVLG